MFFFLQLFLIPTDIDGGIKEQLLLDIQKAIHAVEGLEKLEIGIALVADQIPFELGSEIIGRGEFCGFKPNAAQFGESGQKVFDCLTAFADDHINAPDRLEQPGMARCRIVNLKHTVLDHNGPESIWYGHRRVD